jgi:hypothetical protein
MGVEDIVSDEENALAALDRMAIEASEATKPLGPQPPAPLDLKTVQDMMWSMARSKARLSDAALAQDLRDKEAARLQFETPREKSEAYRQAFESAVLIRQKMQSDNVQRARDAASLSARFQESVLRQFRLRDEEWVRAFPEEAAKDRRIEQTRLNIAAALSAGVEAGLMSEDRAVVMIMVGGLNDRDLKTSVREDQVNLMLDAALTQAQLAGVLDANQAELMRAIQQNRPVMPQEITDLGKVSEAVFEAVFDEPDPEPDAAPVDPGESLFKDDLFLDEDWLARLSSEADEMRSALSLRDFNEDELRTISVLRNVPRLVNTINRLSGLLWEAFTRTPCHIGEHAAIHRSGEVCAEQLEDMADEFIGLMGNEPLRRVHLNEDGSTGACCLNDNEVKTWVRYGQTVPPGTPEPPDDRVRWDERATVENPLGEILIPGEEPIRFYPNMPSPGFEYAAAANTSGWNLMPEGMAPLAEGSVGRSYTLTPRASTSISVSATVEPSNSNNPDEPTTKE